MEFCTSNRYLLRGKELFHLSNKCLFSAFCVPGTVLSPGEIAVNKMAVPLCVYISAKLTLNRTTLFMSVFFVPKNTTGRLCCFCWGLIEKEFLKFFNRKNFRSKKQVERNWWVTLVPGICLYFFLFLSEICHDAAVS